LPYGGFGTPYAKLKEESEVRQGKRLPFDTPDRHQSKEITMLRWALGFFIFALVAAVLGFTGIAVAAAGIAKVIFFLFLILFLVTMLGHLLRRS
jgi:uncharacterized membrane protein YtjA (UPF0391 family)